MQLVMPGEGGGSDIPNTSPRKRQMKRQPSNLSDKVGIARVVLCSPVCPNCVGVFYHLFTGVFF